MSKKTVKVKNLVQQTDVNELFQDLMNENGTCKPSIVQPKYIVINNELLRARKLFDIMSNLDVFDATYRDEFKKFVADINVDLKLFEPLLLTVNTMLFNDEARARLRASWNKVKACGSVNHLLKTVSNMIDYSQYFKNIDSMNFNALNSLPLMEWKPFTFSTINYKYELLRASNGAVGVSKEKLLSQQNFLMSLLNKIWDIGNAIYKETSTPDVDVQQFEDIILGCLKSVSNHPELSRCKDAFKYLKNTAHLLRDNFTEYHRDFLETGNHISMLQHYISDVSETIENQQPMLLSQFTTIIRYFMKQNDMIKADGRSTKILNMVNNIISRGSKGNVTEDTEIELDE